MNNIVNNVCDYVFFHSSISKPKSNKINVFVTKNRQTAQQKKKT